MSHFPYHIHRPGLCRFFREATQRWHPGHAKVDDLDPFLREAVRSCAVPGGIAGDTVSFGDRLIGDDVLLLRVTESKEAA